MDNYTESIAELKEKDRKITEKKNKYEKTLNSNEIIMNIDKKNKNILYIVIVFLIISFIGFFIIENKEIYLTSIIIIAILYYIILKFIIIEPFTTDKTLDDIETKLNNYTEKIYGYLFNQIHYIYNDVTNNVIKKRKINMKILRIFPMQI